MSKLRMIMVIICVLLLMSTTLWSAQTTNWSGTVFQQNTDTTTIATAGIVTDAVLIYDYSAGTIELSDAIGGAMLGGGDVGSILFWDGLAWVASTTGAGVNEIYWDDTNKSLGIGADADDDTASAYLVIEDDTLVDTEDFWGAYISLTKTGGVTTNADDYFGISSFMGMDQNGATVGRLEGGAMESYLYDGTASFVSSLFTSATTDAGSFAGDIYGVHSFSFNGGTVAGDYFDWYLTGENQGDVGDDCYLIYATKSLVSGDITDDVGGIYSSITYTGTSIGGNLYGANFNTDSGDAITGTIWGIQNDITSVGGAQAIFGQQNNVTKTSDNVTVSMIGTQTNLTNTAGDVGVDAVISEDNLTITAGTITGDLYGEKISMDQNGGTATNAYGLYILQDYDGTVTDTYGVYLDEATGVDYGFYQNGTSMNYLGGSETLVGNQIYTPGTITFANGDNDAATAGVGTVLVVTGPTLAFNVGGITTGGVYGRMIKVINLSGQNCTLEDDEIASAGCIVTMTGADITSTGNCSFELIYLASIGGGGDDGWAVVNFQD